MIKNKKINILRISKETYYKIYLNTDNLILEELMTNNKKKYELRKNVLDYSVYIDEKNKIHIIYINNNEEIKYITYPEYMKEINILKIKNESNTRSLNIKIFDSNTQIGIRFFDKGNISVQWDNVYHKKLQDVLCFQKNLDSYIALELSRDTSISSLEAEDNKTFNDKKNYTETLLKKIKVKEKSIIELKEKILSLEKEVNYHNNIKKEELANMQRYYEQINKYEKIIEDLKEEQYKIQFNTNQKINSLLKIIEEKNNIISNLHSLLK